MASFLCLLMCLAGTPLILARTAPDLVFLQTKASLADPVVSATQIASGAVAVAALQAETVDITKKLSAEVKSLKTSSNDKVKSLKSLLVTNSKSIAALTGLFKEVSKLTKKMSNYEADLVKCKKELADVRSQGDSENEDSRYLSSVNNDPLEGPVFLQEKLSAASHLLEGLKKASTSLLQIQHRHHHHHKAPEQDEPEQASSEEFNSDEESQPASQPEPVVEDDAQKEMTFGLNTLTSADDNPAEHVDRTHGTGVPGEDALEFGMYDFTGDSGVKIYDHDSLDPEVIRKRELAAVNKVSARRHHDDDDDDDDN